MRHRDALRQTSARGSCPGSTASVFVTTPVAGVNVSCVPTSSSAVQLLALGQAIATSGDPRSIVTGAGVPV